jgi:hypothetical protein
MSLEFYQKACKIALWSWSSSHGASNPTMCPRPTKRVAIIRMTRRNGTVQLQLETHCKNSRVGRGRASTPCARARIHFIGPSGSRTRGSCTGIELPDKIKHKELRGIVVGRSQVLWFVENLLSCWRIPHDGAGKRVADVRVAG